MFLRASVGKEDALLAELFWTGSREVMTVNANGSKTKLWNFTAPAPFVYFYVCYKPWSPFAIVL